jgi:HK97 gp10 family phage protein
MSPEDFAKEMARRAANIKTDLGKAINNSCQLVENTAKKGMTNTQIDSSKVYHRGSVSHSPSVDFDYPAVDTGRLRQSITHDVEESSGEVVGRVGTNVVYGAYLELGTSKMSPRPWLKPSLANNRDKIHELIMKAVQGRSYEIGNVETAEE